MFGGCNGSALHVRGEFNVSERWLLTAGPIQEKSEVTIRERVSESIIPTREEYFKS